MVVLKPSVSNRYTLCSFKILDFFKKYWALPASTAVNAFNSSSAMMVLLFFQLCNSQVLKLQLPLTLLVGCVVEKIIESWLITPIHPDCYTNSSLSRYLESKFINMIEFDAYINRSTYVSPTVAMGLFVFVILSSPHISIGFYVFTVCSLIGTPSIITNLEHWDTRNAIFSWRWEFLSWPGGGGGGFPRGLKTPKKKKKVRWMDNVLWLVGKD